MLLDEDYVLEYGGEKTIHTETGIGRNPLTIAIDYEPTFCILVFGIISTRVAAYCCHPSLHAPKQNANLSISTTIVLF